MDDELFQVRRGNRPVDREQCGSEGDPLLRPTANLSQSPMERIRYRVVAEGKGVLYDGEDQLGRIGSLRVLLISLR